MMRQRDYLRGKANKTGSKYLRQAFQQVRNKVDYTLRNLKSEYYTRKIEENKNNLKNTWKVLKQVVNKGGKSSSIDKLKIKETEIVDKQKISEEMNNYFASIGINLARNIPDGTTNPIDFVKQSNSIFKFKRIVSTQVHNLIMKAVNGKATGIDLVPNNLLKVASPVISPHLSEIFNQCIEYGIFPDDLKIGKVVPIFKSGKRDDPGNYRPISILSAFARIFEKLLYEQLHKYFEDNNILGDKQWGFRPIHSTIHALQKSINNWLLNIDKGKTNAVIFLYLKKAFDTVDHDILIKKLSYYGLNGKELSLLQSYLSNRSQCCSVNGKVSNSSSVSCGVPQGSILGPLYSLFIWMTYSKSQIIVIYPCMLHLWAALKGSSDISVEIIPDFLKICDWLQANKLSLNIFKTEYMIIGTEKSLIQLGPIPKIKVGNRYLDRVTKTKSLGLIIDDNLHWGDHIDDVCS